MVCILKQAIILADCFIFEESIWGLCCNAACKQTFLNYISLHRLEVIYLSGNKGAWCWRHQMETFPALLALCAGIHRSPVNSPHKGQWRGALVFSLICAWINGWGNNRGAGDLRRHRAHYDVIVMKFIRSHYAKGRNLTGVWDTGKSTASSECHFQECWWCSMSSRILLLAKHIFGK